LRATPPARQRFALGRAAVEVRHLREQDLLQDHLTLRATSLANVERADSGARGGRPKSAHSFSENIRRPRRKSK
jgi:hypothetical protein